MNQRGAGIGQIDSTDQLAQGRVQLQSTDTWIPEGMGETCRRAAAEGIVLLTNRNETLPLAESATIAVLGRVQRDYFMVGYGSGGDVRPPYTWNLIDALQATDLRVDEALAERYAAWCADHPVDPEPAWGTWPRSHPEMPLTADEVAAAADRASTAVVVIGRAAGEAREQALEEGGYYLTADERALLSHASAAFERTVVVVDTGNVVDLAWTQEYDLDAVLLAWQGGMESGRAVADVLTGAVPAGGKLTATIATAYDRYPSAGHFGGHDHNEYVEDVYVGYRWFETFAPEHVLFPFGYGLTYASFDVRAEEVDTRDGEVVVRARVTNTHGVHRGTEVVQAYVRAPQGALGRPARHLAAFGKTRELAPGESETLELRFRLDDLAAYDDTGATGHRSAYVLEAGRYEVLVGTDVRTAVPCGGAHVAELRVVRQVTEAGAVAPGHAFERVVARTEGGEVRAARETVPEATVSRRDRVLGALPAPVERTGDRGVTLADVAAGDASLDEFVAQLDDDELEALSRGDFTMDSSLGAPGNAGALAGTVESLRAKGVPALTTTDGPAGIRLATHTALLPSGTALASTWNPELVTTLNALLAVEMAAKGSDILLSPGMNIQRDPLCGRNFEYFSEDPLLTGRMAAATVRGIQSEGLAACPKHFAANNQEDNREYNDSRVSERALREIYLRGFEICVAESAPRTLMTSYNKINGVWGHYHHDLVTTILRGEWGFDGAVMTDWWMREAVDPDFPAVTNDAYRVRAQVDVHMPGAWGRDDRHGDGSLLASLAAADGVTLGELQRTAANVLRLALSNPRLSPGR
ncbi:MULTISPECIES: glycoside hydrolase family 3 protein [unclassified Isoptericola]|uniref:beta-glucosidase n=1 Tax=unclassified Isoptericola TaxID=2623355 RepID=UPI0027137BB1|nr:MULTISPECIES: glycoside hydrolase family 3 N-terminal domain-containing protein [unclassified Isoptericola]MDO8149645.1 glycoside hydrolase family 3 N-terminal domain-containing protein [Isoptericola sp. b515]MDO8152579.1 glycoside hydrolase family 3 N-terminal domain-containing protein [Isoptericola sp. b408]